MERNMKDGLKAAAPDKEMIVTLTGDFEDAALATEALKAQIDRGCKLFYPYLGGALPAAVQAAARAGVGVMATSQNLCGVDFLGATVQESILYNPQLYLPALLRAFAAGKIKEGKQFALYGVGDYKKLGLKNPDDGVGAVICNPTPQEKEKLDQVRADIASGKIKVGQAG
jgi:basic membrane protein A